MPVGKRLNSNKLPLMRHTHQGIALQGLPDLFGAYFKNPVFLFRKESCIIDK